MASHNPCTLGKVKPSSWDCRRADAGTTGCLSWWHWTVADSATSQYIFSCRVINVWNSLPDSVSFKSLRSYYYGITVDLNKFLKCFNITASASFRIVPVLNASQTGWYSIYLPRRDGRLSWPRWPVIYRDDQPSSTNLLITNPTS